MQTHALISFHQDPVYVMNAKKEEKSGEDGVF